MRLDKRENQNLIIQNIDEIVMSHSKLNNVKFYKSTKKPDILILQTHALNKGGKLLTVAYINCATKMLWECSKKHTWAATWNGIYCKNYWCPVCAGHAKSSIDSCIELANLHNGTCISKVYVNNSLPLEWKCSQGHIWFSSRAHIKHGSWCPTCAQKAKPTLEFLHTFARTKNGKLLSTEYKNNKVKLLWECNKKHSWLAPWKDIGSNNSWCPECSSFKTERECKQYLESSLGVQLNKTAIKYEGKKYEFDGYNEEHKIAFEYHGYQHYIFPNYFHKTEEIFKAAQERDRIKEQYCIDNNIKLIVIPYTENKNLYKYIDTQISEILYAAQ